MRPNRFASTVTAATFLLSPRRIARYLARRALEAAEELARIDPPEDVAAEHAALIGALRAASLDLGELAKRDDLRAFERFEAMAEIELAQTELRQLEAKGYRVPR